MHGSLVDNEALVRGLTEMLEGGVETAVCVPFPYLSQLQRLLKDSSIGLGAQDVSEHEQGAYTGQVSAAMLCEFDCEFVIVGHSERRSLLGEGDTEVGRKAAAALAAGLTPIVCIGETLAQREAGEVEAVLGKQLEALDGAVASNADYARVVIAYEPVWAIGTGHSASPEQVDVVCGFIREWVARRGAACANSVRVLYGGSVKPETAGTLFALNNVDGGLIGGASLKAGDFSAICRAV